LEEQRSHDTGRHMLTLGFSWFENLKGANKIFVHRQHSTGVVKLAAIIGSGEYCDEATIRKELVAVLNHLVGSANEIKAMLFQELAHHILSKCERYSTIIFAPASLIPQRVAPQQIAHYS